MSEIRAASPTSRRLVDHPLYPWAVWLTGSLLFFYAFFHRVAPSVMVSDLMRDFEVGGAILGTLSAFYFYPYASLQIPLGMMLDRWGPRRVLACAAALCGVGSVIFATSHSIPMAYLGRALIGCGAAFGWIGTLTLIALWFPSRRFALVAGLTSLVGMAGAIGGQAPLAAVVGLAGWRATLLGAAVFGGLLGVAFWAIVRDRRLAAAPRQAPPMGLWPALREVMGNWLLWADGLVIATVSVPLLVFAGLWGVPYMIQAHGMTRPVAAACTSLILIGWGLGAIAFGWISDRIGSRKNPILFGSVVSFGAILTVIYVPGMPEGAIYVLLFATGFFGAAAVLCYAVSREYSRPDVAGTAMGFINMMSMGISAVIQPLVGWLLDLGWQGRMDAGARVYPVGTFQMAFLSLVGCAVIAIACAAALRETRCRPLADDA